MHCSALSSNARMYGCQSEPVTATLLQSACLGCLRRNNFSSSLSHTIGRGIKGTPILHSSAFSQCSMSSVGLDQVTMSASQRSSGGQRPMLTCIVPHSVSNNVNDVNVSDDNSMLVCFPQPTDYKAWLWLTLPFYITLHGFALMFSHYLQNVGFAPCTWLMTHDLYERCNLAQAVTVVVTMPPKGGRKRVFAHGVSNEVSTKFAAASTKACRTENQVPQLKSSERQDSDTGMFRQAPWIDMWSDCAHDMFSDAPSTSMAIRRPNMLVTAFKRHLQSSSDIVTLTRKLLSKFERFVWGRNTYILAQYSDENGYTEVVYSTSVTTEQFTEAVLRTRAELNEIRIDGFFLRNLTSEINQYEAQVASVITTTDWRFMKQGYGFDILLGTTRPGLAFCINASTLDISIATRQQVDAIGGSSVVIGRTTLGLTDGFTRLQFPHVAPNASSPWMVFIRRCFPLLDTRMRVQYVLRRAQVRRHLCEGMFLIVSYTSSGKTSFVKCVAKRATGEVLRRLTSRAIARSHADTLDRATRPFQFALQARSGADSLASLLRVATELDADATIVSIDGRSAYDCISRAEILQAVHNTAPALVPYVRAFYSEPTIFSWWDNAGIRREIAQAEGIEQGDSLAPALFALGQHRALQLAADALQPTEFLAGFLDDLYIITTPDRALDAFHIVTRAVETHTGVAANLGKTRVYHRRGGSPPPGIAELGADVWCGDRPPSARGFVALGTPIGHPDFIAAHRAERLDAEAALLTELTHLPDLQAAWLLLTYCAAPRANHLLRTLPPSQSAPYAEAHDDALWRTLCALLPDLPKVLN